jgi:hypothetical protein
MIANPGTKRCETYRQELGAYWRVRRVTVDLTVVPWSEVVERDGNLDRLPAFDRPAIVRMESPGKDEQVTRLLLEAGARDDPQEPHFDWRGLSLSKGQLLRPGLLYRGFRRVLRGLRRSFDVRPYLRPTACPLAIAEMFDKAATCRRVAAEGVPVPEWLPPEDFPAGVVSFSQSQAVHWPVVYTKLNTGSSATGIVVSHHRAPEPVWGVTSLAYVNQEFYNSRRIRTVEGVELDRCLSFLLCDGAIVQRGIPMAQIDGQNFDVRVVCVYGKPVATIFRLCSAPMTNLHLGGRRGELAYCRAAVPTRQWLDALDHCSVAAGCFDSAIAGVDLLFERGYQRHYVLEVNAFGDFFPGWADAAGRSVHAIEIEATRARLG